MTEISAGAEGVVGATCKSKSSKRKIREGSCATEETNKDRYSAKYKSGREEKKGYGSNNRGHQLQLIYVVSHMPFVALGRKPVWYGLMNI